jgi:hypothetical protein
MKTKLVVLFLMLSCATVFAASDKRKNVSIKNTLLTFLNKLKKPKPVNLKNIFPRSNDILLSRRTLAAPKNPPKSLISNSRESSDNKNSKLLTFKELLALQDQ